LFYFLCLSLPFPSASTSNVAIPQKEYAYTAGGWASSSDPPSPRPRLPYPRIDGLHVCTYRAFLKSLNFYLHLPTHTQGPEPVRSMVASRAVGAASSGRREWPSVRGGRWLGARRRHRHLGCQGRPCSAPELWEARSDLGVGAKRGDRCLFRVAASAQRERRRRRTLSSLVGEREE
jgi:hypothetical protein